MYATGSRARAALDERLRSASSKPDGGGSRRAGEQRGAIPAEHVPGEHLGVERGSSAGNAGRDERVPRRGEPLVQRPIGIAADQAVDRRSVASLSFSDWK